MVRVILIYTQSVSYPQPEIHLLDASSLIPSCAPICDLPVHSNTGLPTFSLSGRLLAFVTSEPPRTAGPDGLGSLVTARSTSRVRSSGSLPSPNRLTDRQSPSAETTTQGALLNSAAEISGGVARGVWAGIKLGARAAGRARNGRLARSAPVDGSVSLDDDDDRRGGGDSESRSLDESSVIDEPMSTGSSLGGGEWIKVVDLKPRSARKAPPKKDSPSLATTSGAPSISASQYPPEASSSEGPEVTAHFRLPLNQFLAPSFPAEPSQIKRHSSALRPQPISNLSFSPSGTQLFAAAADGRIFHVFDIHPAGALSHEIKGECKGEVWHLYELRRGSTAASVCEVTWDKDGRWLGVGTGLGTIRMSAIRLIIGFKY